jgi:hypothetical protein
LPAEGLAGREVLAAQDKRRSMKIIEIIEAIGGFMNRRHLPGGRWATFEAMGVSFTLVWAWIAT